MIEVFANGLRFYRFHHLAGCAGLRHAVFSRLGGVSMPPFDRLNIALGSGDHPDRVKRNRQRILQTIGGEAMVFGFWWWMKNHSCKMISHPSPQRMRLLRPDPVYS